MEYTCDDALIQEMVDCLVAACAPEKIILFGSRGRGDARPDSDLDLMVIESEPFRATRSRRKEMTRLQLVLPKHRLPVDVLVFSRDEIDFWSDSLNHVIGRALREGKTLYERH